MSTPYFSKKTPIIVPSGSKAGDLVMQPCIFRARHSFFKSEEYAAECGTLVVPENWGKTDSRLIALPVLRIRATEANPKEPIFHLEGGPGSSNMEFVPPGWLLKNHDFVLVGYRGIDGSCILDCPTMAKAARGRGDDLLGKESLANFAAAVQQDSRRLLDSGIDLARYTIIDVIEDIEAARRGLGYERIDLLSESYGTRVALIYAWMYPNSLLRSAMIGVNPPGRFVFEPDTIDSQLAYYADIWAMDPLCTRRSPNLLNTMRNVSHHMPRRWLFLPIDRGKVRMATFSLLYYTRTAAMVFDAYVAAERGDPSGLALMSLVYDFMFPNAFSWGDLYAKGYSADYDPARDYETTLDPPNSVMGSPQALFCWSAAKDWPATMIPAKFRQLQHSSVETLLVSGSIDFSTPAQYATKELLPYLSNGKQVVLKEFGHCEDEWRLQPKAFQHLLTTFFDTGVADDSLFHYEPINFHVRFGFPAQAKILISAITAVVLILPVLIWLVFHR